MKKFYDIEIDSQIELENGKTLGKLEESKISVNDGNCGSGGASDPIVENAKQTGGIGYTERGEQTVIVDESVTTVAGGGYIYGQFATPFNIVEGAYTVIFNGTEYNLNSAIGEEMFNCYLGDISRNGPDFSQYPFVVADTGVGRMLFTESSGDYEVTVVKKSSDTVHKIDEKYLPEGGGGGGNDFVIELPSRTGALTESTIAQLDSVADFIDGNLDKKQPYTIKCYVPHPDIGTIIVDCTVSQFKYNDNNSSHLCRITGSNLSNMSYTQDGLEFFCVDFYKNWDSPWTFNFKTVALEIGDMF